jgi:rod shape-determining protein MreD
VRNTLFFLAGVALLLLQANLFRVLRFVPIPGATPSLVLPLIVFMGVHEYSLARGAAVAFMLGYATDVIGIAPVGLYTFTFVAIFILARAAGVRLAAQTTMTKVALAFVFTLLHSVMVLVLVAIFGRDAYVPRSLYPMVLPHAVSTALLAPLVFALAQKVHALTVVSVRPEMGGRP